MINHHIPNAAWATPATGTSRQKGILIPVSVILDNLAAGMSETELLQSYPALTPEAIRAVLAYAAELAREQLLPLTG